MADLEDLYDDDDGDLEWLYVEDHYDDADDLAEHAVPSPPAEYGTGEDYDPYAYFEDLAYLSDSYYDETHDPRKIQGPKSTPVPTSSTNGTRKRKRTADPPPRTKHSKPAQTTTTEPEPRVVWRSRRADDINSTPDAPTVQLGSLPRVALLPDWAARFDGVRGLPGQSQNNTPHGEQGDGEAPSNEEATKSDADVADPSVELDIAGMDLGAVASLLTDENMTQLRSAMAARGLDPEAIEVVLGDLLAGREPEFDEEGGDENDEDGGDENDEDGGDENDDDNDANADKDADGDEDKDKDKAAAPPPPKRTRTSTRQPREAPTPTAEHAAQLTAQPAAQPARRAKRKAPATEEDGDNDGSGDGDVGSARPARGKRAKAAAEPEAAEPEGAEARAATPLAKTTRSGRRRK